MDLLFPLHSTIRNIIYEKTFSKDVFGGMCDDGDIAGSSFCH